MQSAFTMTDEERRAQKEEQPLISVLDSFKKVIVVGGSQKASHDDNGIVTMGLKQFLLEAGGLYAHCR